jgi:hypothetical protein
MMDIIKWLALNWGEKYPVLSTLGAMALAAILWNVLIRMNADNLPKTQPPSITQTTSETTGKVVPTISNNQGSVTITIAPPDEKQKEK